MQICTKMYDEEAQLWSNRKCQYTATEQRMNDKMVQRSFRVQIGGSEQHAQAKLLILNNSRAIILAGRRRKK